MPELTETRKNEGPGANTHALRAADQLRRTGGARFPLVDSLRAIAALFVFTFHVAGLANPPHTIALFTGRLNLGVTLFFVISGFLLYRPFVAERLIRGRKALSTGRYAWHRFLRIVPAYWVALTVISLWLGNHYVFGRDAIVYYGFGQVYGFRSILGGVGQASTLSIEVAFYVFLPFWAWAVGRVPARTAGRRLRVELIALALLAGFSLVYKPVVHGATGLDPHLWFALDNALPHYLDQFAIGMALAVASVWLETHRAPRAVKVIDDYPWIPWAVAAVALTILATQFGQRTSELGALATHYLATLVALGLFLPAVFGTLGRGFVRRFLGHPVMIWIGVVSYGLFLWHVAVIIQVSKWGIPHRLGASSGLAGLLVWAGVCIVPSLALAAASWYGIERPALRHKGMARPAWLKRLMPPGRPSRVAALGAGAILAWIVASNAINPPGGQTASARLAAIPVDFTGRGWVYIVATYDSRTLRVYQDARLIASARGPGPPGPSSAGIEVGSFIGGAKWTGPIKYVAVYPTDLTPGQISRHYQAGLANWFKFDAILRSAPAPTYLWRNRLPAIGSSNATHPRPLSRFSLEAWVKAYNIDNRVVVNQPNAWMLQTDVFGHWRAAVFVNRKEIDANANVAPPRAGRST